MRIPLCLACLFLAVGLGIVTSQARADRVGTSPLESLARDRVYEFAFIGGSLKLRGADGALMRPGALPVRKSGREADHD
ncbi:MAG: hypothetical protein CMN57_00580 [Gammaproteobacteria bacterium]|nr:hypothetical protein [Gammaproteobacteria bacterium]